MEKIIFYIAVGVLFVCLHSLIALYIDRLNYKKNKKSTNWEFIPFVNVYMLGKLAFNRLVGAMLLVCLFFVVNFKFTLFGNVYGFTLLPTGLRTVLFIFYLIIIIGIIIYAITEYDKITKNKDKFRAYDMVFFIKETLWIIVFCVALYLFIGFVRSASV